MRPLRPALALACCCLAAAARAGVELAGDVQNEARARTLRAGRTPRQTTAEIDVVPKLTLEHERRSVRIGAGYMPRLRFENLTAGAGFNLMHQGHLGVTGDLGRDSRLMARGRFTRGENDLLATAVAAEAPVQAIPARSTLPYLDLDGSLTLDTRFGPRTKAHGSAGFQVTGGADADAREVLPLQRVPRASAGLEWDASRVDVFGSLLAGSYSRFSTGREVWMVDFRGTWRHEVTPSLKLRTGAGATAASGRGAGLAEEQMILPAGELGVELEGRSVQLRTRGDAWARYAPSVDRLTGRIDARAESGASVTWAYGEDWTFGASAQGAVMPRGGEPGGWLGLGSVHASWRTTRRLALGLSLYGQRQHEPRTFPADMTQWGASLSASVFGFERGWR